MVARAGEIGKEESSTTLWRTTSCALGGFERCWSRSDTSKADGAATGALESSEGPDQPWAFVRCDNSGTFRSNQMADNAYPSKVFRLDSPAYPSSLGDWLWPPSCEVALGFCVHDVRRRPGYLTGHGHGVLDLRLR